MGQSDDRAWRDAQARRNAGEAAAAIEGYLGASVWRCECDNYSGLYARGGDPDWWSCVGCDGRVQEKTDEKKRDA